jgi:phosphatidate cytidylyltransferase
MALPQARADRSDLWRRVASAAVLAPVALAATWAGGGAFALLVLAAVAVMAVEWGRLIAAGQGWWGVWALAGAALAAVLAAALGRFDAGVAIVLVGTIALAAAGLLRREPRLAWLALGLSYVALPCLALIWLRADPQAGLRTVLWILVLVWAIDSCAYFAGRTIGGPRLAPQISPSKTWAGLGGGVAGGAVVGAVAAALGAGGAALIAVSGGLAIVAQAGDLMESAVKRHFHVKDAGTLIPGHGGLLDRVDGLIMTILAVAAMSLSAGGSPLQWR